MWAGLSGARGRAGRERPRAPNQGRSPPFLPIDRGIASLMPLGGGGWAREGASGTELSDVSRPRHGPARPRPTAATDAAPSRLVGRDDPFEQLLRDVRPAPTPPPPHLSPDKEDPLLPASPSSPLRKIFLSLRVTVCMAPPVMMCVGGRWLVGGVVRGRVCAGLGAAGVILWRDCCPPPHSAPRAVARPQCGRAQRPMPPARCCAGSPPPPTLPSRARWACAWWAAGRPGATSHHRCEQSDGGRPGALAPRRSTPPPHLQLLKRLGDRVRVDILVRVYEAVAAASRGSLAPFPPPLFRPLLPRTSCRPLSALSGRVSRPTTRTPRSGDGWRGGGARRVARARRPPPLAPSPPERHPPV